MKKRDGEHFQQGDKVVAIGLSMIKFVPLPTLFGESRPDIYICLTESLTEGSWYYIKAMADVDRDGVDDKRLGVLK